MLCALRPASGSEGGRRPRVIALKAYRLKGRWWPEEHDPPLGRARRASRPLEQGDGARRRRASTSTSSSPRPWTPCERRSPTDRTTAWRHRSGSARRPADVRSGPVARAAARSRRVLGTKLYAVRDAKGRSTSRPRRLSASQSKHRCSHGRMKSSSEPVLRHICHRGPPAREIS